MLDPLRAARLTLLALRSGVPSRLTFESNVVRLGHRGDVVTIQVAVDDLARRPKPLACYAEITDGVLVLNFPTQSFELGALRDDTLDESYRDSYGPNFRQRAVMCVGSSGWSRRTVAEQTRSPAELARMVEWNAMYWALRPTPLFIREFTEHHRPYSARAGGARRAGYLALVRHSDHLPLNAPNASSHASRQSSSRSGV